MIDKEKVKTIALKVIKTYITWMMIGCYACNIVRMCNQLTEEWKNMESGE